MNDELGVLTQLLLAVALRGTEDRNHGVNLLFGDLM
jgi:hypothetical protein